MKEKDVFDIQTTMLDGCIAYELGGNWRLVFSKAKHRAIGAKRRALELLQRADDKAMDRICRTFMEHVPLSWDGWTNGDFWDDDRCMDDGSIFAHAAPENDAPQSTFYQT